MPLDVASDIAEHGVSLAKLQGMDVDALQALGLERRAAERILDSHRAPIPADIVARLMHECRRTCCVCREKSKSLVLHHTREWAKSRSHDEELLVVVCASCHGEAHTRRELGRNLTPDQLLRHRKLWAAEVAELDARALLDPDANRNALGMAPLWDYFNHRRISRIAAELSIEPTALPTFAKISATAPLDELGAIDWPTVCAGSASRADYMYSTICNADGVYSYFADLLTLVVSKSKWIDLVGIWSPAKLKAVAVPGHVAILTAGFRFKSAGTMSAIGPGQKRKGYYKKDKIRLHFMFDAWEATSTSSRGNLSGIWRATAVCMIRTVETEGSLTNVEATCLGIGTGFGPYPSVPAIAYKNETLDDEETVTDATVR